MKEIIEDKFENQKKLNNEIKEFNEKFNKNMINDNYSFCPKNNDGNFKLSNLNRTLEKTSGVGATRGFHCENLLKFSDKLMFSIKIERTMDKGNIMIGFCLKAANNAFGYHKTKPSFMLYLSDGHFYNSKNHFPYNNANPFQAKVNQIYTSILDMKKKSVEFLLNGKSLGAARIINLQNEEIPLLCPCVDLYYKGDKISISENVF